MDVIEALRQAIQSSLEAGDLLRAAGLCEQLPGPESADAADAVDCLYRAAHALDGGGDFTRAEALYRRILTYPTVPIWISTNVRYRLGICMQMQGKTEAEIADHFRYAAAPGVQAPEVRQLALYSLGCLLLNEGNHAGADEAFAALMEGFDAPVISLHLLVARRLRCAAELGGPDCAARMEGLLARLDPASLDDDPALMEMLFAAGLAAERGTLYEIAGRIYRALLQSPRVGRSYRANAHFRLGLVLEFAASWWESPTEYRKAIELADDDPHGVELAGLARFHLAHLLAAQEDYEEAAAVFQELALRSPLGRAPEVRFQYALCLLRSGDPNAAEQALGEIAAPEDALGARIDQTMAEIHEYRKDYKKAVDCYERMIRNSGADVTSKWAALQRLSVIRKQI